MLKGPMKEEIINLISTHRPLTGSEIKKFLSGDNLLLQQTRRTSSQRLHSREDAPEYGIRRRDREFL